MHFDVNQAEFPSEIHQAVWAVGKSVIPFEISTAEITDQDLMEGLAQVYRFSLDLYTDMYRNPEKYELLYGRNCMISTGNVTAFHRMLYTLIHTDKATLKENDWEVQIQKAEVKHQLDLLLPMGIVYESRDEVLTIKSEKYPLLLKYFYLCYEASQKRKVNCLSYIVSCDFRIFNKRLFKRVI